MTGVRVGTTYKAGSKNEHDCREWQQKRRVLIGVSIMLHCDAIGCEVYIRDRYKKKGQTSRVRRHDHTKSHTFLAYTVRVPLTLKSLLEEPTLNL